MAKKTVKSSESTTASPAAPAKRRAPARKKTSQAAPAIDLATVGGIEPMASAADAGVRAAAGTASDTTSNNGGQQPSHEEIAQAAYFRHLNRGGSAGGDEFDDWVQAERELRERKR
jgi:hypothetical protein